MEENNQNIQEQAKKEDVKTVENTQEVEKSSTDSAKPNDKDEAKQNIAKTIEKKSKKKTFIIIGAILLVIVIGARFTR